MSETLEEDRAPVAPPGAELTGLPERDVPDTTREGEPVGFVGLGAMGLPMAAALVRAGIAVLGCDSDMARLSALVDLAGTSARVHTTPVLEEVAARCTTVVLMLPTSAHVADAVAAMGGVRPGTLLIDMGSSVPSATRALAATLAERGVSLIDAPVSGSVAGARDGTLTIMAGGGDAAVARAVGIFAATGKRVIRTGPVGSAHAMKTLNNFVYAAGLLAASEAVRMAQASGLDPAILTDIMNASSGRNFATETKLQQFILSGTYDAGFRLALMAKDIETAATIAEESGVDAKALAACRAAWTDALEKLGIDADNTAIHRAIPPAIG